MTKINEEQVIYSEQQNYVIVFLVLCYYYN